MEGWFASSERLDELVRRRVGTPSRERRANGRWRTGARGGERRGKSRGPVERGHVVKYAEGNKGQWFPTECEGSGEGWCLGCEEGRQPA